MGTRLEQLPNPFKAEHGAERNLDAVLDAIELELAGFERDLPAFLDDDFLARFERQACVAPIAAGPRRRALQIVDTLKARLKCFGSD